VSPTNIDLYSLSEGTSIFGQRYRFEKIQRETKNYIVVKAVRTADARSVALKFLPEPYAEGDSFLSLLDESISSAQRYTAEGLIRVHGVEQEGKSVAIVEDWIEGITFLQLIRKRGAFSIEETAQITNRLAQALDGLPQDSSHQFHFQLADVLLEIDDTQHREHFLTQPFPEWSTWSVRISPIVLDSPLAGKTTPSQTRHLQASFAHTIFHLLTGSMRNLADEPVLSESFTRNLRGITSGAGQGSLCQTILWDLFRPFGEEVAAHIHTTDLSGIPSPTLPHEEKVDSTIKIHSTHSETLAHSSIFLVPEQSQQFVRLSSKDTICLGRSQKDSDFVAQFYPRSELNDSRTMKISRKQLTLASDAEGKIKMNELDVLNRSQLNGEVITGDMEMPNFSSCILASEYDCQIRRYRSAYDDPVSLEGELLTNHGGVAIRSEAPHALPFLLGWCLSDLSFRVESDGSFNLFDGRREQAHGRIINLREGLWIVALQDNTLLLDGSPLPTGEAAPLLHDTVLKVNSTSFKVKSNNT